MILGHFYRKVAIEKAVINGKVEGKRAMGRKRIVSVDTEVGQLRKLEGLGH